VQENDSKVVIPVQAGIRKYRKAAMRMKILKLNYCGLFAISCRAGSCLRRNDVYYLAM